MHLRESFEEGDSVAEQAERRAKVHCTPFLIEDWKSSELSGQSLGTTRDFLSDPSPIIGYPCHSLTN